MPKKYLQIDSKDNLIVALADLEKGFTAEIDGKEIVLSENVKSKHKFTVEDMAVGDELYMYGVLIGKATAPIKKGSRHYHRQCKTCLGSL